jgi:hypothetical protein
VPITINSDLPRITADLAKARLRIQQMQDGRVGVLHPTPEDRETPEQFQARNPHAGRAFDANLKARYGDLARLERQYLDAMIADGHWPVSRIVETMSRPA